MEKLPYHFISINNKIKKIWTTGFDIDIDSTSRWRGKYNEFTIHFIQAALLHLSAKGELCPETAILNIFHKR